MTVPFHFWGVGRRAWLVGGGDFFFFLSVAKSGPSSKVAVPALSVPRNAHSSIINLCSVIIAPFDSPRVLFSLRVRRVRRVRAFVAAAFAAAFAAFAVLTSRVAILRGRRGRRGRRGGRHWIARLDESIICEASKPGALRGWWGASSFYYTEEDLAGCNTRQRSSPWVWLFFPLHR